MTTDTLRSPALPVTAEGTAVTVGTFDGVHRGHWAVIRALKRRARRRGARSVLLTFEPHPLRVVRPDAAPSLLTTAAEKKQLLAESGLDCAVFFRFTSEIARYSPRRFVEEILVDHLQLTELVVGYDHGLGRGRSGDVETLRGLGDEIGFAVHVVPAVAWAGSPVSSTRIRDALLDGAVGDAAEGLGRPYSAEGVVIRGEGRGRALGVPTANIRVGRVNKLLPRPGVYAVQAILGGEHGPRPRPGVLHLGPRPTFQGAAPSLEVHLLDFDGELYGTSVRVEFCERLRGVISFDSADALVEQIGRDIEDAGRIFDGGGGACQQRRRGLH